MANERLMSCPKAETCDIKTVGDNDRCHHTTPHLFYAACTCRGAWCPACIPYVDPDRLADAHDIAQEQRTHNNEEVPDAE